MTYWIAGAAAVGALADRKNPLRGAALGAGAMMTGGAALGAGAGAAAGAGASTATAGGLLGNAAGSATLAGTGATGATAGAFGSAGLFTPAAASVAPSAASGSTLGSSLTGMVKPVMTGMQVAQMASPTREPPPSPQLPTPQTGGGATQLNQIVGSRQQIEAQRQQAGLDSRAKRQQMLAGMGYGGLLRTG